MVIGLFFGTQDDTPTLLRRHGFPASDYVPRVTETPATTTATDVQPVLG